MTELNLRLFCDTRLPQELSLMAVKEEKKKKEKFLKDATLTF